MTETSGSVIEGRVRLEGLTRVAVRVFLTFFPRGAVPRRRALILVAASAGADVGVVAWLRRQPPDRFGFWPRLGVNAVDTAVWVAGQDPSNGSSVASLIAGVPLAMEAGYRRGFRGLVVPATTTAVASATNAVLAATKQRGRRPPVKGLWSVSWQVMGVVLACASRRWEETEAAAVEATVKADIDAAAQAERRIARHRLFREMGATVVVDQVKDGLIPALESSSQVVLALQSELQERKEEAWQRPDTAVRLGTVLEMAADNRLLEVNQRRETVRFSPRTEDDASAVLTARQAQLLLEHIENTWPTGDVSYRRIGGRRGEGESGEAVRVALGHTRIRLPADRLSIEMAPIGWLVQAVQMAANPLEGVPGPIAAVSAALALTASGSSWWLLRTFGRSGRTAAVAIGTLPLCFHAIVASRTARPPTSIGGVCPIIPAIQSYSLEVGYHWPDLSPRSRAIVVGIGLACITGAWTVSRHRQLRVFATHMACWPTLYYLAGRQLRAQMDGHASAIRAQTAAQAPRSSVPVWDDELRHLDRQLERAFDIAFLVPRAERTGILSQLGEAGASLQRVRQHAAAAGGR